MQDIEIIQLKERLKAKEMMLDKEIAEIKEMMKPLSETYRVAVVLGKWVMGLLVFISVLIGVILGLKSLLK